MTAAASPRKACQAWADNCEPARLSLQQALSYPEQTQRAILRRLLRENSDCMFGRQHRFAKLRTAFDFQSAVPTGNYDTHAHWVERVRQGESGVLTTAPVLAFEKTSGSAAAAKYIPYTAALRREFQRAVRAWLGDLFRRHPATLRGPAYWSLTPLTRAAEVTPGGIPVGFSADEEYFSARDRRLLRAILAVPQTVVRISDSESCLYVTLRFLLQHRDLALISVWNPSLLTLLMAVLDENAGRLLRDLADGTLTPPRPLDAALAAALAPGLRKDAARARRLEHRLAAGRLSPGELWPSLGLISCWTDAASALALPALRERFSGVPLQGKGLLATEGIVTIPWGTGPGCVVAATSHFYEFIESESAEPRLLHELEPGRDYSVLLSTGGGLWRYRLGDRVRVVGFERATPRLEFIGREDGVCDLRGEKLHPAFVGDVLEALRRTGGWNGPFAMLAPLGNGEPPSYGLFVESRRTAKGLAARLDERLRENPHYDYCRRLGQLGPSRIFRIGSGGEGDYLRRMLSRGQRLGDIKPVPLHRESGWEQVFDGGFAECAAGGGG